MRAADQGDSERHHGAGLLAIAWLLLFAAVAGTATWLYFYGGPAAPSVVGGIPGVVAPLPPAPEAPSQETAAPSSEKPSLEQPSDTAETPTAEPSSEQPPPATAEAAPEQTQPPVAEAPPAPPTPSAAEAQTAEAPKPEVPGEAAASAPPPPPPPTEAKPAEAKPVEAKPAETKPAEAKPAEAKPAEVKPAETKPAETKPAEVKPAEVKPEKPPTKPTEKAAAKPPERPPAPAPKTETRAAAKSVPPAPKVETQTANLPPEPIPHGPDPALIERDRLGPLPVIGPHGRQPWQVYAKPFDQTDNRPRIAVVITDLGLSDAATEAAIQQLPGSVTLAFSPYAKGLEQWTNLARAAGHEVMLDLPMEPVDYPDQDPGPYTLLTSLDVKQNLFKMRWLLSRATGYVGVTNQMGSRFTTSGPDLKPVLQMIKERGLLFLDSRSSEHSIAAKMAKESGMAWAYNNRFLDAVAARDAIDRQLEETEKISKKTGYAVAMGSAYPVTIERVAAWIPKATAKGFAIAPVSAIADKQPLK